MKRLMAAGIFILAAALFGSGISYAAPMPKDIKAEAQPEKIGTALTPESMAQAVAELKTASIPYEVVKDAEGEKTTFDFEQGFSLTIVKPTPKPSISAFIGGSWDRGGPYVLLNKFDIDMIISGAGFALGTAICAIPGVGWIACASVGTILWVVTNTISAHAGNPCVNKQMKIYVSGTRFGGCA